jgi:hypothetical protein
MQLGTENRNKTIAAVALAIVALVMVVVRFFPQFPGFRKDSHSSGGIANGATEDGGGTAQAGAQDWYCACAFA